MEERYTKCIDDALVWIHANYTANAIFVCGSIIRGTANANSDFDIYVLHSGDYRQRVQKFFNGVPCEIFINNLNHTQASFERELKNNRPCTAHMLATGIVYFDDKSVDTSALVAQAQKHTGLSLGLTAQQITAAKYSIALAFEDATDVLDTDEASAKLLLHKTVSEVIIYMYALNKIPLPGIKFRIRKLISVNQPVAHLIAQFYAADSITAQYNFAGKVLDALDISRIFFEWTSDKDKP